WLMMSLWDALRMNMMISYQELVRTFHKSVSFGPVVMARFDEDTNKKLIAAKNKSNRSKSHEVYLRLKAHLFEFPDFYSSEVEVIRRSVSET
ncbi:TraY domain-containing protein, partial [Klebsiella pneumoniae]|uniref:TraY domain-containing protein n=1 Tax=Klebsiella pneumoniae TaxID=573 RepID=UPI0023AF815B